MDIVVVWALIILLGVAIYVILDGFDLGVGILFPFFNQAEDKTLLMDSIAPVWDGNETWMILGGAALFAVFPIAYSVILSGLYLPIIFMLIALIFRGVSFEFRGRALSSDKRRYWDIAFFLGSLFATFFQGIVAGVIVSGVPVKLGVYDGNALSWITPFNLLAGVGLVFFYALLGATWLIKKTENVLQDRVRQLAKQVAYVFFMISLLLLIWTLVIHRSFLPSWKNISLIIIGIMAIGGGGLLLQNIESRQREITPFVLTLVVTLLGALALIITIWPYVIPFEYTIWDAAAPMSSLKFTLVGALIFIPIIIFYNAIIYYVFRGKVRHGEKRGY